MAPPRSRTVRVSSSSSSSSDDDVQLLGAAPTPSSTRSPTVRNFMPAESVSSVSIPLESPPPPPFQHAAIESLLQSRGVRPTRQWLAACVDSFLTSRPRFSQLPLSQQAECCLASFLVADLNNMGAPILPPNVRALHATELTGPFVLQVDEIVDIGSTFRNRYKECPSNATRCLKLSMTDGVQRIYGIEYRPIKDLKVLCPAGVKVAVHHVTIRRGLLLLVPEGFLVLGGHVEHLEAAQQRLYQHVNKPPRGEKNIKGAAFQSLSSSATAAAWPCNNQTDDALRYDERAVSQGSVPTAQPVPDSVNRDHSDRTEHLCQPEESSTFTYLALLEKMWASDVPKSFNILGRVKCILTGVKEFNFKTQDKYRLLVYIDDGSQIASVMVDHHVVEGLIGFSPREVSRALGSTNQNEVTAMKDTLSRFQAFLTKFEGIMLIQKATDSGVPLIIEMTGGCEKSEAWSLAHRLQTQIPASCSEHFGAIEVSP